ncbi:MAG: hypothetical protein COA82_04080 [Alkaliphilus sp.]|nr:MAG: hypothetical protein COA82_04080 [Alkaliphilus sp.]
MVKQKALGFGYIPDEAQHHFLVQIPRSKKNDIYVYERFSWDNAEVQSSEMEDKNIKVVISFDKWAAIKAAVEKEFNRRLQVSNILVAKFKGGDIPLERLFGKELVLLLWAIENSDPSLISIAIKNWLGLSPEERWWLFTMTNASTGHYANRNGWRIAIRYALTENPIDDKGGIQGNITELLYKKI